ncbi:MAG: hypothetical protein RLY86_1934 [Pseudomonadota bacterium]|jgi:hypothetical protein
MMPDTGDAPHTLADPVEADLDDTDLDHGADHDGNGTGDGAGDGTGEGESGADAESPFPPAALFPGLLALSGGGDSPEDDRFGEQAEPPTVMAPAVEPPLAGREMADMESNPAPVASLPRHRGDRIEHRHDEHEQETRGMTRTFISMAKTGGQGKTLVAQMLVLQHELRGVPTKLAAADSDTLNQRSKFGRLFANVKELGIGEELTKIKTSTDPNLAIKYWDEFGRTLLDGGNIIDVGANVAAELFSWAEARNDGALLRRRNSAPIDLVVTTKAEGQAIEDARALIQYSFDKNEWLPLSRRFVILNEVAGSFAPYENDPAFRRLRAFGGMGVQVITMKRCESDIWNLLEKEMISVRDALKLSEVDLEKRFGIDVWTGHGGLTDLKAWAEETVRAFEAAGLAPARPAMAAAGEPVAC